MWSGAVVAYLEKICNRIKFIVTFSNYLRLSSSYFLLFKAHLSQVRYPDFAIFFSRPQNKVPSGFWHNMQTSMKGKVAYLSIMSSKGMRTLGPQRAHVSEVRGAHTTPKTFKNDPFWRFCQILNCPECWSKTASGGVFVLTFRPWIRILHHRNVNASPGSPHHGRGAHTAQVGWYTTFDFT